MSLGKVCGCGPALPGVHLGEGTANASLVKAQGAGSEYLAQTGWRTTKEVALAIEHTFAGLSGRQGLHQL